MGGTVAIIPARGGSKGIARKNLAKIGGLPLVARSIQVALESDRIDSVFVSSDDAAILGCAIEHGAKTIERGSEISGDTASSEAVLLDALQHSNILAMKPERVVMMQCTSPFTTSADLNALVAALDDSKYSSAVTVAEDHSFLWTNEDGEGRGVNHDASLPRQRRQDLPPQFRETGAAYAMRTKAFERSGSRFCGTVALVLTDHPPLEIDEPADLAFARRIADVIDESHKQLDLANVQALITDFDGVHTDDLVIVDQFGTEAVRCSRSDGMGVERLREAGLLILILSKESNEVVARRAEKLKIPVIHGERNKLDAMHEWVTAQGLRLNEICYVGNDMNDLACMNAAGVSAAPADARSDIKLVADIVLENSGGGGAVREICDLLIDARNA